MKVLEGVVKSLKTKDTAVVVVESKIPHKLYKKLMKRSRRYKASLGGKEVSLGQTVKIKETKPISKDKHFEIVEVKK
ncbi:MAG: 30S ribosomal protein S17 [Candidatus Levybacteria bacterium GW2011_GWA2_40_8]|nr:MAG: 30S ribosomal protein S17 [Candidatus Levybacteria bacterium GW2011_GWA2_40_8]